MKSLGFTKLGCLLAVCAASWMASLSGSAEADCAQTVQELRLELAELEVLEGADGAREEALAQERALIADEATIEGDFEGSYTESILWRASGTRATLEKRSAP
jgi:hypothetical protein